MNTKKVAFLSLFLIFIPLASMALDVSFGNPVGTAGTLTQFFEAVMQGILNIIAFLGVLSMAIAGVMYLLASSSGNDTLIGTAKKIWTGAIAGLALALAGPSFLKQIKEIILSGGAMPISLDAAPSLTEIVGQTLSFLLSVIGIIAIISLVINSIVYLTAFGDSGKTEKVKTNINYSILGFLIAGSALVIVEEIVRLIESTSI